MTASKAKIAIGGTVIALIVLAAIFAPLVAPHDPYQQQVILRLKPPVWMTGGTWRFPLGTDSYGRDVLSRLIFGSRLSILVGIASVVLSMLIGTTAGVLAGYVGGKTEEVIMRTVDAQTAFPDVLLAILFVAALGGSFLNLIVVLGISGWMVYARIMFGLTRSLRERPFVEAAVSFGGRSGYIMLRHILPQLVPVLTVVATLQVGQMILQETALSFLGLGVPPPAATWGNILAEGRDRLFLAPWIANSAGIAIVTLVLTVNILGNGLREWLDPKS
ncbi:ABC transporter permease [Bradyrhizobium sp. dw_411]|uniref:ABC transporter permease n=1 Tax=Bradyrhizobium sp. dw_411 TaxID=2720082 RepID=UPI001BCF5B6C